jgi:hypothetical protein
MIMATQKSVEIRKWLALTEETLTTESGVRDEGAVLRKIVVAAAVKNPFAGRFGDDLHPLVEASAEFGREFGRRLLHAAEGVAIQSYGKACIVGTLGEYEHGNALLTSTFADPIREILGGGKAWIPSTGKRGELGAVIDVPLAHKDALYVRSHYDTISFAFPDAPAPGEIVVIFAVATRGRLRARLGGLSADKIVGDGLR